MDATRLRRTRDRARQRWYALFRSFRFARHLGFTNAVWRPEKPLGPAAPVAATVAR
jgi:hypothetical protein